MAQVTESTYRDLQAHHATTLDVSDDSLSTIADTTPQRPSRNKGLTRSYALEDVTAQVETVTHHPAAPVKSSRNERIRTLDESEITLDEADEPTQKKSKGPLEAIMEKNKAAGKEWARK
jgi:hypothetical protein